MQPLKIVIIGDGSVGKTSLLISYTLNRFDHEYLPTIFDTYSCITSLDSQLYQLSLWDTAGQEEYDALRCLSYKNTDVFIICFSLIDPISFKNIKTKWHPELVKNYLDSTPKILVGTKLDLRNDIQTLGALAEQRRQPITFSQGHALGVEMDAYEYIECLAIKRIGVEQVFNAAIKSFLANKKEVKKCIVL